MMSAAALLQTWDILQEFGFRPDASVYSEIQPGLCFAFGEFDLSASAVMSESFAEVVMFTGVLSTPRRLAEVQFGLPRQVDSREHCAALLAWYLDRYVRRGFGPLQTVDWLDLGRASQRLLPWVIESAAYEARPFCSVNREWARPMLKKLKADLRMVPAESEVWFSFDGEVLKIRCGCEFTAAAAATGKAWPERYGLKADRLRKLPARLMNPLVEFSMWKGRFHIAGSSYDGVFSASEQP